MRAHTKQVAQTESNTEANDHSEFVGRLSYHYCAQSCVCEYSTDSLLVCVVGFSMKLTSTVHTWNESYNMYVQVYN